MFSSTSAGSLILSILSKNWPQRANQIYAHVKKHKQVTYQAVHKALEQMVEEKILTKKDGVYAIDLSYAIRSRKNWEAIEESYKKTQDYGKSLKLIVPESNYLFEAECVLIDSIPSVFISKSTFLEFIEELSTDYLDKLAKKVAIRDYELIAKKLPKSESKKVGLEQLIFLQKLNELANSYYWGKVAYSVNEGTVDVKISSFMFTTKKAKHFYEKLYVYFMDLLGFKLKKKNDLLQTYSFEVIQ
ncbi:Uncharacterised protein [uncultured archaeon]|nr:Uncharacterised protein [uncultured archaeon]